MKKYNTKIDSVTETDLKKVLDYFTYLTDFITTTEKRSVNIEMGSMGGTHWTWFYVLENKSIYFDSFAEPLDKILLQQTLKPIFLVFIYFKTLRVDCAEYFVCTLLFSKWIGLP